ASPPGMTPADVDLRRLLTLYDESKFWSRYPGLVNTMGNLAPYALLPQPATVGEPGDYRDFRESPLAMNTMGFLASSIALGAFASLSDVRNRGTLRLGATNSQADRFFSEGLNGGGRYAVIPPLSADERAAYYDSVVRPQDQSVAGRALGTRTKSVFDLSDEFE